MRGRRVRLSVAPPFAGGGDRGPLRYPLLLVHGLGCSGEVWHPLLEALARRGSPLPCALAPDMPGFGHSAPLDETPDMDALADWLAELLAAEGVARAHLISNSMGGQVVLALAERHPERVVSVVPQGPTVGMPVPFWRYTAGLVADGFQESGRYNLKLMQMYFQMGVPRYFAMVGKMREDDAIARARRVSAPTLVVRGRRDSIVSDRTARRLVAALPNGVYASLPDVAHAIEYDRPDLLLDTALPFWRDAEAAEATGEKSGTEEQVAGEVPGDGQSRHRHEPYEQEAETLRL